MVEDEWGIDPAIEPKLVLLKLLKEKGGEPSFLDVADKGQRRMMIINDQGWDSPTQGRM